MLECTACPFRHCLYDCQLRQTCVPGVSNKSMNTDFAIQRVNTEKHHDHEALHSILIDPTDAHRLRTYFKVYKNKYYVQQSTVA